MRTRLELMLLPLLAACWYEDRFGYVAVDGPGPDARGCDARAVGAPESCPPTGCPRTFTTDPAKVCPTDPAVVQTVWFWTMCNGGVDVIEYTGVDTAAEIFFRSSDGSFVGYGNLSLTGQACVAGVPPTFSLGECFGRPMNVVCGRP